MNWRSRIDIDEENRYGHANADRPKCRQCGQKIADDNWRGGPVVGYLCSRCDELNAKYTEKQKEAV